MNNHPFRPLRHRAVRLLLGASVVSDIGTWVQLIVVGSLVAADTGSAVQTGLVALATFMPQGIAAPVGGLLADRFDRRKVFAYALLGQAAVTTGLAIALGLGVRTPAVLTLLILLGSAAGSFGAPSAAAMQPDLVPPEELMAMVSLGVYSWNGGRIIGPLLGSVLVIAIGPAWTIGFNAFSFIVMATAVALLRRPFRPHAGDDADATVRQRLLTGLRTVRSNPGCFHGVTLLVLFNLTLVPFMGLIPIYVKAEYEGGTSMAGAVASAQGIGAIIGGFLVTWLASRRSRSSLIKGLQFLMAGGLLAYAWAPTVVWLVGCAAVLGGCVAAMFIMTSSIVQRDAPPHGRGRVLSVMQAAMGICYGLGLLFIGSLGDLINLHVAFSAGAVLMLASFALLTMRSRNWRSAIDGSDQTTIDPAGVQALTVVAGD
ncbi:MAG: MFS transporter [Actinomycetia bacterium]|nr:MFS transporter [Actinomycetes bacterium]